jgi:DNA (cytosine-5)-methyltransferase 1
MTPREYARLMGAGEYALDGLRNNQALFGFGDAVCVPVVQWLSEHYLMPLVRGKLELAAAG